MTGDILASTLHWNNAFVVFSTDEVGQTFVESVGFAAKTSSCGQHKGGGGGEDTMLNLTHSFTILSLLGLFMVMEGCLKAHGMIGECVWMKIPYVKNASCDRFQPLTQMSRRVPSSLLVMR